MKKISVIFLFMILAKISFAQYYIIQIDYWFDRDYSSHVMQSVFPSKEFTFTSSVPVSGLRKGLHTFNMRFQQSSGYWSQTVSSYFFNSGESQSASSLITGYRYWVEDIDSVITVMLPTAVNPIDQVATLDLSWVHKGVNFVYIQFCDAKGNWSVPIGDAFYKSSIPVADFYSPDTFYCATDSVQFINTSNDGDIYTWNFGDGDTSNLSEPVHHYSSPGIYSVSLMTTDTVTGVDSVISMADYIHIANSATADFSFVQNSWQFSFTNLSQNSNSFLWDFGDGDTSTLQDPVHVYSQDGNYSIVLQAFDSCGIVSDTQSISLLLSSVPVLPDERIEIINDNSYVRLLFHSARKNCSVTLSDMAGRMIFQNEYSTVAENETLVLPIMSLSTGIYHLRIADESGDFSKAVFK